MNPALLGALVVVGWTPMVLRLDSSRKDAAPPLDRALLATTWILCLGLTALSAWDAAGSVPGHGGRVAAGIALEWTAMGVWYRARTTLGPRFAQIGPAIDLECRGLYEHLRHPMYAATVAATLGMALAGGRPRDFVPWSLLAIVLVLRATREELDLRTRFGDRWDAYARASVGLLRPRRIRLPAG